MPWELERAELRDHGQGPSPPGNPPSESSGFPSSLNAGLSTRCILKSLAVKAGRGASSKLLCPAPLENLELLRRGPEIHNYDNPLMGSISRAEMKGTLLRRSAIYQPTWMVLSWLTCGGGLVPRDGEALARHPCLPFSRTVPSTRSPSLSSKVVFFFFFNLSTLFKNLFIYFTLNYFIGLPCIDLNPSVF